MRSTETERVNGRGRPAGRPALLGVAGAVVGAYLLLVAIGNLGCTNFLRRTDNLLDFGVLLLISISLVTIALSANRVGPASFALAQVLAGFAVGMLIQPSVSILLAVVEGALAVRALPGGARWAFVGLALLTGGVVGGYLFLKFLSTLAGPELVSCS